MPVLEAIKINAGTLQIMNERIDSMPHEKILNCYYYPEKNRGALEMILAESYAVRKK
jgi:xylose isomerase